MKLYNLMVTHYAPKGQHEVRFEWEPLPDGLDVPTLKAALDDRFIEVPHG